MILLDTTVLVYAVGDAHPLRDPCRAVLAALAAGRIEATTTVEVVQEFVHIRSRRRDHADAARLGRQYLDALAPVTTTTDDLDRGLGLFEAHPSIGAFDAVLAAVALGHNATALISADRAFGVVPGLAWVDPASRALEDLFRAHSDQ